MANNRHKSKRRRQDKRATGRLKKGGPERPRAPKRRRGLIKGKSSGN